MNTKKYISKDGFLYVESKKLANNKDTFKMDGIIFNKTTLQTKKSSLTRFVKKDGIMYVESKKVSNKKDSFNLDGINYNKTFENLKKIDLCSYCKKVEVDENYGMGLCYGCS
jgi:hypothetical protein